MKLENKLLTLLPLLSILISTSVFAQSSPTPPPITQAQTDALAEAYKNPSSLMVSANPELKSCLLTNSDGESIGMCAAGEHVLRLFQGNIEVTGYYTSTGRKCVLRTPDCSIEVYARYTTTCAPAANGLPQASCKKPVSFKINYYVHEYNVPKGSPPIPTVSTIDSGRVAVEIPYSAIFAQKYVQTYCKDMFPPDAIDPATGVKYGLTKSLNVGTDIYGQVICGADPNQVTIDALRDEMCKLKVSAIWLSGGSTVAPCEAITIVKEFKITTQPTKTTTDCTKAGGVVYSNNSAVTSLDGFVGGKITVNGVVTAESAFDKIKYGITSSSPTFSCQSMNVTDAPMIGWTANASFTLPSNYVPDSLHVKIQGGGGGGSGSGQMHGGVGGAAGEYIADSYITAAPEMNCTVIVGSGGNGGATDYNCNEWPQGTTAGGLTSISCAGGSAVSVAGGAAGGQCNGTQSGSGGKDSGYGGAGGSSGGCGQGGAGGIGAGGGGGSTKGGGCGAHSGGSGGGGYAEAYWKVYSPAPLNL